MSDETTLSEDKEGIDIFDLWREYEKIAMHFNDLLIKLRVQALGGVAAVSVLVSFVSKGQAGGDFPWGILSGTFFLLILVWIAIWCLDFLYYNRLLLGAVNEIRIIEEKSKTCSRIKEIHLSTSIEDAAQERVFDKNNLIKNLKSGRFLFYIIVMIGLLFAFSYSVFRLKFCVL